MSKYEIKNYNFLFFTKKIKQEFIFKNFKNVMIANYVNCILSNYLLSEKLSLLLCSGIMCLHVWGLVLSLIYLSLMKTLKQTRPS